MCKVELKNSSQVLFYEKPMSLKFQMLLIDTTPGPSVEGHVIRDMLAEGEQLWRLNLMTKLDVQRIYTLYVGRKVS
jgi:hypothetical protein